MNKNINFQESVREFKSIISSIEASGKNNKKQPLEKAVVEYLELVSKLYKNGRRIYFIGNGGSAAIAGHQAIDWLKNGKLRTECFNDSALLTCLGNDYGYEHVFEKPLHYVADKGDILVAISSSGRSENIIRATKKAVEKELSIVTLTGFDADNPLRQMGDINIFVASHSYYFVESAHLFICQALLGLWEKFRDSSK
ncbi:SIS domain-containing protein [Elusimicrobiota bacterium]